MARRGSFMAKFLAIRYLLFIFGVLLFIGDRCCDNPQPPGGATVFALLCIFIGFPYFLFDLLSRFVVWLLRLFGIGKCKPAQIAAAHVSIAHVTQENSAEVSQKTNAFPDVIQFIKGERYTSGDRVFECLGLRGIKERRAGFLDFGYLEYSPRRRGEHPDTFFWYVVRIENGVEVCDRGRLRADSIATKQQADDYARMVKEREDGERAYWAERRAKRERDAKRLEELERIVQENGLE